MGKGRFLKKAIGSPQGKLSNNKYPAKVFKVGLLIKALSEEYSPDFKNLPKLYKDLDLGFLRTSEEKNRITSEDQDWLFRQLDCAYGKTDQGWFQALKVYFERELADDSTIFCTIRDDNQRLVGIIKTRPTHLEDTWYSGTFYVDKKYSQGFGAGKLLRMMATYARPDSVKRVIASVATYNDTASVFLEVFGGVMADLVTEGRDVGYISKPLFKLVYDPVFDSLHSKELSLNEITKLIKKTKKNSGGDLVAFKVNAALKEDQSFLSLAELKFSEGYVMRRLIYEKDKANNNKMDISKGYAVFEKLP